MKSVFRGQKKSQTRPNIFPWYFTILGWTFPTFYIEFPTWNQYFGDKKNPKLGPTFSHDIFNIGINIPNFLCWIPNVKSVFLGQKKSQTRPQISHDIYQHWDEHSQCMTSISQHPLWNCISQSHFVPLQFCYSLFQIYYANINSVIQFPILLFAFDLCCSKSGTSCNKAYFSCFLCKIW